MAKILDLKLQLQTAKKGGANCAQYLQQMQSIADRLRSIGTEISDQELVLYTLQGLGTDFDNFVTAVSLRSAPLSMIELTSLLLTHEARLLTNLRSASTTTVHLTAAPDTLNSNPSACYANNYSAQSTPPQVNFSFNHNNRGRGSRGRNNFRGRGRGRQTNPSQTNSSQESPQCLNGVTLHLIVIIGSTSNSLAPHLLRKLSWLSLHLSLPLLHPHHQYPGTLTLELLLMSPLISTI